MNQCTVNETLYLYFVGLTLSYIPVKLTNLFLIMESFQVCNMKNIVSSYKTSLLLMKFFSCFFLQYFDLNFHLIWNNNQHLCNVLQNRNQFGRAGSEIIILCNIEQYLLFFKSHERKLYFYFFGVRENKKVGDNSLQFKNSFTCLAIEVALSKWSTRLYSNDQKTVV